MQAGSSAAMASPVVMSRAATAATAAPVTSGDDSALLDLLASDLTFTLDRKAETEKALMEDLLASLRKEKDKLEEDAWRYAAKRSQPNLNS